MNREAMIAAIYENSHAMKKSMYDRSQSLQDQPVSSTQLHLLFMIKHNQPINAKQLANKLQLTPGAISQLVDGLSAQGLLDRTPSPTDRRIHQLALSQKGEQTFKAMEAHRRQYMDKAMASLNNEELAIWLLVQQKILEAFTTNLEANK